MKLTSEQVRSFDEQGYMFFPNCFSEAEVALLREEAAFHRLSLSAWMRVLAQTLKLPAPAEMPISVLRSQVHQLVEDERARTLRKNGH